MAARHKNAYDQFRTNIPNIIRNMAIQMAMDLWIDEKDEERESEAQSAVWREGARG